MESRGSEAVVKISIIIILLFEEKKKTADRQIVYLFILIKSIDTDNTDSIYISYWVQYQWLAKQFAFVFFAINIFFYLYWEQYLRIKCQNLGRCRKTFGSAFVKGKPEKSRNYTLYSMCVPKKSAPKKSCKVKCIFFHKTIPIFFTNATQKNVLLTFNKCIVKFYDRKTMIIND